MLFTRIARARDRGFSFIELLAYMAIAALLILAAIPQFDAYREKARVSNLQNDAHNAGLAAEGALIDAVSARTHGKATIRLASTIRLTAAATSDQQTAITNAVGDVKTSDGNTLTTSFPDDGSFLITAANRESPYKAIYASQLTHSAAGTELKPGVNLIAADDTVVEPGGGGTGEDGGDTPDAAPDPASAKVCSTAFGTGIAPFIANVRGTKAVGLVGSVGGQTQTYSMTLADDCSGAWSGVGTDGGYSINTYNSGSGLQFSDDAQVILGYDNTARKATFTIDGGLTWQTIGSTTTSNSGGMALSGDGDRALVRVGDYEWGIASGLRGGNVSVTPITRPDYNVRAFAASPDLEHLWAWCGTGAATALFSSDDGGHTWTNHRTDVTDQTGIDFRTGVVSMSESIKVSSTGRVITASSGNLTDRRIAYVQSTDGGATWKRLSNPNLNWDGSEYELDRWDVSDDGATIIAARQYKSGGSPGLMASTDHGETWAKVAGVQATMFQSVSLSADGHHFLVTRGYGGTYSSTEYGRM